MKKSIKFVYFDVGGVMLRWKEVLHKIAKQHNKPFAEVHEVFLRYDTLACLGKITSNEAGKHILTDLGVKEYEEFDFLSFSMRTFAPIRETHRFAEKLSKKLPIGLLTNVYPEVFELSIQKGHIPDLAYAAVVQSCKIGLVKPNADIYHHARQKANVAHEEILFVDDYAQNIAAAKKLGWRGVVFDTENPKKSLTKIKEIIGI